MVVLIRCNDIVSDPRAMKYIKYLRDTRQEYLLIGWDREGNMPNAEDTIYYRRHAGYSVGGFKAVINRIKWMFFVLKTLIRFNLQKSVIHACDLDASFPVVVYNFFISKKKKSIFIFDVFDWFSATLYNQNIIVLTAFKIMEWLSVKKADYIILCEPERIEQIPFKVKDDKLLVLPNIPFFEDRQFLKRENKYLFNNNLITFAYVGGFAQSRCINEIISIAEDGRINLLIAGYGNKQIEDRLFTLKKCPNIKYYGKVKYTDGLCIMYNADIVYAMYSKSNPNHIYAAPNKYYEALFLGKPLFTTKGTIVEKKVISNNIGYISEESKEEIVSVIDTIDVENIENYGRTAGNLWHKTFSTFTFDFLCNNYQKILMNNLK